MANNFKLISSNGNFSELFLLNAIAELTLTTNLEPNVKDTTLFRSADLPVCCFKNPLRYRMHASFYQSEIIKPDLSENWVRFTFHRGSINYQAPSSVILKKKLHKGRASTIYYFSRKNFVTSGYQALLLRHYLMSLIDLKPSKVFMGLVLYELVDFLSFFKAANFLLFLGQLSRFKIDLDIYTILLRASSLRYPFTFFYLSLKHSRALNAFWVSPRPAYITLFDFFFTEVRYASNFLGQLWVNTDRFGVQLYDDPKEELYGKKPFTQYKPRTRSLAIKISKSCAILCLVYLNHFCYDKGWVSFFKKTRLRSNIFKKHAVLTSLQLGPEEILFISSALEDGEEVRASLAENRRVFLLNTKVSFIVLYWNLFDILKLNKLLITSFFLPASYHKLLTNKKLLYRSNVLRDARNTALNFNNKRVSVHRALSPVVKFNVFSYNNIVRPYLLSWSLIYFFAHNKLKACFNLSVTFILANFPTFFNNTINISSITNYYTKLFKINYFCSIFINFWSLKYVSLFFNAFFTRPKKTTYALLLIATAALLFFVTTLPFFLNLVYLVLYSAILWFIGALLYRSLYMHWDDSGKGLLNFFTKMYLEDRHFYLAIWATKIYSLMLKAAVKILVGASVSVLYYYARLLAFIKKYFFYVQAFMSQINFQIFFNLKFSKRYFSLKTITASTQLYCYFITVNFWFKHYRYSVTASLDTLFNQILLLFNNLNNFFWLQKEFVFDWRGQLGWWWKPTIFGLGISGFEQKLPKTLYYFDKINFLLGSNNFFFGTDLRFAYFFRPRSWVPFIFTLNNLLLKRLYITPATHTLLLNFFSSKVERRLPHLSLKKINFLNLFPDILLLDYAIRISTNAPRVFISNSPWFYKHRLVFLPLNKLLRSSLLKLILLSTFVGFFLLS